MAYICREVLTDEMIEQIAEKEFELLDEEACDKNKLMAFEAEYKEVSKKIENILEAIENGLYTPKTKERLLDLEAQQSDLESKIVKEKLKKPEFTKDHIVFWLTKFRAGDINDYDYKKAVINALVNSVFVYDDDEDDGNHTRIVVALNLKNTPARTLTCSDVNKVVEPKGKQSNLTASPLTKGLPSSPYSMSHVTSVLSSEYHDVTTSPSSVR